MAVFRALDVTTLPMLDRALTTERDFRMRRLMEQTRASALLATSGAPEAARLDALAVLRTQGDGDARAALISSPDQPPAVVAAAAAIDGNLQLSGWVQNAWYGLSLGSVLLPVAAGLVITFGVMGVINRAHGELVMLDAYVTFLVREAFRAYAPEWTSAAPLVAMPVAFLLTGVIGVLVERGLIRFLYGRPLKTLFATFDLSLVTQQAVRSLFGPTNREVGAPAWMSGAVQVGGLQVTWNRLAIIVFTAFVVTALMLVLRRTALGVGKPPEGLRRPSVRIAPPPGASLRPVPGAAHHAGSARRQSVGWAAAGNRVHWWCIPGCWCSMNPWKAFSPPSSLILPE